MIKITKFFYINGLVFPLFLIAYYLGTMQTMLMAYSVVMVHELFHLFGALLLKVRVQSIIIMPFGMTLRLQNNLIKSPVKEAVIALLGPLANVLMIASGKILQVHMLWAEQSLFLFLYLNYITLFINLLPALPLDGGRVMRAILTHHIGYISSVRVMRKSTKAVTMVLMLLGVILLYLTKFNMSLLMIATFLAFYMVEEQKQNEFILMKEWLYTKDKLPKKGVMRSKNLSAMEQIPASQVFKMLSYHNFHNIYIVNDKMEVAKVLTEAQLVEGVVQKGYGVSLAELMPNQ